MRHVHGTSDGRNCDGHDTTGPTVGFVVWRYVGVPVQHSRHVANVYALWGRHEGRHVPARGVRQERGNKAAELTIELNQTAAR